MGLFNHSGDEQDYADIVRNTMLTKYVTYDFDVQEIREYCIQGSGRTRLEAEQDAVERFYRLLKSGDLSGHLTKRSGARILRGKVNKKG